MPNPDSIQLSLLENSHAYLKEAVTKALAATQDIRQWQFAILNLVQSLELSLKAALKAIHPIFVYEDIDNPRNTVGLRLALQRLEAPNIGGFTFSEKDKTRIRHAAKIRNQVTHSDFVLTGTYAAANFMELFAFVSDFQRSRLGVSVAEIIPATEFQALVQIRKLFEELVRRAEMRISEEQINKEFLWLCPNCGEDTFVLEDGANLCYACFHVEAVVECPQCSRLTFESDMESFFGDLDTDYSEGVTTVHNSYGYLEHEACPTCLPEIKQDIQDRREQEEFHRLEEEYYYLQSRHAG
jgi:rubrerythrin